MNEIDADIQAQVDLLSKQFAARLPDKLARIEETWAALQQNWDIETRDVLQRMIHSLVGSGGSFGFTALSNSARELEQVLKQIVISGMPPETELLNQFVSLLERTKRAIYEPDAEQPLVSIGQPELEPVVAGKMVFLLEEDPILAQDLCRQLGYFGYRVSVFATLPQLQAATKDCPPAVVIMDIILPEGQYAENGMLQGLCSTADGTKLPLIFISQRSDLPARMRAVRAGGAAYFTKPVDIGSLIDKLDRLTTQQAIEPYRVLIVDDEPSLAAYHQRILTRADMIVRVVNDPLEVMAPLIEMKPDLILMDMYMPGIDGSDLASVIRQQEAYVSIPIVFLSAETDISKQLLAMQLGGDDFLTKPIKPDHLISAIKSRVERLRILRGFMVRDSLTGLLNHTFMKQQLEVEVSRARRQGTPVSFALIDIDHFKSVNDSYGHPCGDRVIKSLSRMLKQRLRETDLIGRYGGEEFAVILPDTDATNAARVLDELRAGFGQIHHQSGDAQFYVTFSCGVSSLADFDDASALNDAADRALYVAKQAGRNCVIKAQP